MSNEELIAELELLVLKRIKERCASCADCKGCRFSYNDGTFEDCALDYEPVRWRLKEVDE